MLEINKTVLLLGILMEKLPSLSVSVPLEVPLRTTLTPCKPTPNSGSFIFPFKMISPVDWLVVFFSGKTFFTSFLAFGSKIR